MREFNDADRKKKRGRIQLPENPGNLSDDTLARLRGAVEAAVKGGYVACPAAWNVAKDLSVSRLDVGVMIDRLGIRVTDCQLGCFAVSKADHSTETPEPFGAEIAREVAALHARGELTCPNIFALAGKHNARPRSVADAANAQGYKLGGCQLGCF